MRFYYFSPLKLKSRRYIRRTILLFLFLYFSGVTGYFFENPNVFYCVCVKRITHCNCLCFSPSSFSASCVQNTGASHIRDFGPCHYVKSNVCRDLFIPSENGFDHFKEKRKRQARVVL